MGNLVARGLDRENKYSKKSAALVGVAISLSVIEIITSPFDIGVSQIEEQNT